MGVFVLIKGIVTKHGNEKNPKQKGHHGFLRALKLSHSTPEKSHIIDEPLQWRPGTYADNTPFW